MAIGDMLRRVTHFGHRDRTQEEPIPTHGAAMPPAPEISDSSRPAGAVGETPGDRLLETAIKVGEPGALPGTNTKIAEPFALPGLAFGGHRATAL